jgi:undecaprenyl phosphate N,N'-diacetylbacillosamine 1-phosphate transferase
MYKKYIKRLLDIILSCIAIILFSPVFFIIAVLVRIKLGSPIFFKQDRVGKNEKIFRMIKFRTMTDKCDKYGSLLPDEQRITQFGSLLRSTSLDELPELLNILRGDLSIVGPRSLPPVYNEYFTEREMKRFEVRGGLIPPDSVDEKAVISWDKQLEYEASYAENLDWKLDLKILFCVFRILFNRKKDNYGSFVRKPLNVERGKNAEGAK